MSWVRIEDGFFRHRKVVDLSKDAKLLFIAGLCHCADQTTDGFISIASLRVIAAFVDVKPATAALLVDAGLWHKEAAGFRVHDYLDYQPSAEDERKRKAENAERVRRWRESRKGARNGGGNALQEPSRNGARTRSPNPNPISLKSRSDLRPPVAGAIETESERAKATALAELALGILANDADPDQVLDLVWWAAGHVDLVVVDEALGYCSELDMPPRQVSYLAKTIRSWAAQRDVDMPEFRNPRKVS